MRYLTISFILISVIFSGCHKSFVINGIVKTESGAPLKGVKLSINAKDHTISDSAGSFKFKQYLTGRYIFSDVEVVAEKYGFIPAHVNLSENKDKNISIVLNAGKNVYTLPKVSVKIFYYLNLCISVFNAFTIIFILFTHVQRKAVWIILLLILNPVFALSVVTATTKFHLFHAPIFLLHYIYQSYTVVVAVPVISTVFWVKFFRSEYRYH